jgi:RHS repeat-associated protein
MLKRSAIVLLSLLLARSALAQSGVSDDRVSLPDGPGSIGGVGENVSVVGNMGAMSLRVPFRVPRGFDDVTPSLGLQYSSSQGSGVVGIGWAFDVPSIERATFRGLPEYDADDAFVADGSEQLVRVGESTSGAVYRARYERGFVRYTWRNVADGKAGYFTAEFPDGSIGYYGADRDGNLVPEARVTKPGGGTFRYMLVESVDPFGHREHYAYVTSGNYPLLDSVDYVHDAQGKPRFSVRFVYGERPDLISDGKPGFDLRLTQRLTSVRVFSGAELIRQYDLDYEGEAVAGGMSRLAAVTEKGRGGATYPIKPTFGYSQTLGGACSGNCGKPFVVDMGTLSGGVDLRAGAATLLDINGDSLPDVLDTTGGTHRFFISKPSTDGKPTFGNPVVTSKANASAFQLTNPSVQVLDVNGDGFSDMVAARTGDVLCNNGSGDWSGSACLANGSIDVELADDPSDTGVQDPLHVRFFDYDNDKRIDMLRTTSADATDVRRDTGMGFVPVNVAPIGEVFDDSALQLAEMNADGLLDPVIVSDAGTLRYRLNLGFGTWSDWTTVQITGLGQAELRTATLQDLNGDGLDDLVSVTPGVIKVLLNRNGARFAEPLVIDGSKVDGTLPPLSETTTVLYADMNGNGSDDVVFVSSSGNVQFVDLFPVKPNLLARVENGIGMVQAISYGTSLAELARDNSWAYKLNYAMNVVKKVDQWVTLTGTDSGGLHQLVEFAYHDGFYDGAEKQFRGFSTVEQSEKADALDSQQPGFKVASYDVGAKDAYYNGLLLRTDTFAVSEGGRVPLRSVRSQYGDCPVGGVPASGLAYPVRHVCETKRNVVEQEGAPEDEWAVTQTLMEYDAWGNVGREQELGVVGMGDPDATSACRACIDADDVACGPMCLGDETYTETSYVDPEKTGKWFLRKPAHLKIYGVQGGPLRETSYFYDGEPFVGLPEGQLAQGKLSREQRRVSASATIDETRAQFDAHGNELVILDPLGSPTDPSAHRTRHEYDALGLNLTVTETALSDAQGPYALRREYGYESVYNQISEATAWMVVRGGAVVSSRDSNKYRYDEFERIAKLIEPGDSEDAPTSVYSYELASPVTRITVSQRSQPGGPLDSNTYRCLDGRGRLVQTITSVSEGRFQADGFLTLNSRGARVRAYQPYELSAPSCAAVAPDGVLFTSYRYDPLYRPLEVEHPDASLYDGKASVSRFAYGVLSRSEYDEEDNATGGTFADTPTVERYDGDGRLIALERDLGSRVETTRLTYDSLDNLKGYIDAAGNVRTQEFDQLDRVVRVSDANTGVTTFEYDAASNLTRQVSAGGDIVRHAYDGLNRRTQTWSEPDMAGTLVTRSYDALADCKACSAGAGELLETRYPVALGEQKSVGFDRYGYDARKRRIYEARSLEGKLFELSHGYDNLDRLTTTTYPDGQTLTRKYDGLDRLTAIPGVLTEARYDARGKLAQELLANGAQTSFAYDARIRLARHSVSAAANDVLFDLTFKRDRVDNVASISDAGKHAPRGVKLGYDAWYRPTSIEYAQDAETVSLGYDAIDNITSRTSKGAANLGALSYGKQHPNATTGFGGITLTYSADGDLEKRGALELGWDYQGRLVRAASTNQARGSFAYGDDEERVAKDEQGHVTYYISDEFEVRDGVGVLYPRDGARRYARIESTALSTRLLADGNTDGTITVADALLAQKAKQDPSRLLAASAKRVLLGGAVETTFLHQDHLTNVVAATDGMGKLSAERTFYDWGDEHVATGFVDEHGFSDQERDPSTGLVHYRFRSLDPEAGRWVSADPKFDVVDQPLMRELGEATTGYAFVANNLGNGVDALGLDKTKAQKNMAKAKKKQNQARSKQAAKAAKNMGVRGGKAGLLVAKHTSGNKTQTLRRADGKKKQIITVKVRDKKPKADALTRLGRFISPRTKDASGNKVARDDKSAKKIGAKAIAMLPIAASMIGSAVITGVMVSDVNDDPDTAPSGGGSPASEPSATTTP